MEQEIKTVLKKSVKIAGVTCLAMGGAALIASGAALKALMEGAKYVKDAVQKIIDEQPGGDTPAEVEAEVISDGQTAAAAEETAVTEEAE